MKVAHVATYPPREAALRQALPTIAANVDRIKLVLNEYGDVPDWIREFETVEAIIPDTDLKDLGKFLPDAKPDDIVFLCDDDILLPADYSDHLIGRLARYIDLDAVIGVHGIIYSDFFTGGAKQRAVYSFRHANAQDRVVNQLGTGLVCCFGYQLPSFDYMKGSSEYVDVRFARHCHEQKRPMVCVSRKAGWLEEIDNDAEPIFTRFTQSWPADVIAECRSFSGYRNLPAAAARVVRGRG